MTDEYSRIEKRINDYFQLIRKLMAGTGRVPEYVLRRLKLEGRKIEGLIPKLAKYGASRFSPRESQRMTRELKEQIRASQTRVNLALNNLQTNMLQQVNSALTNAIGIAAGAQLFAMAAQAIRNRRQEYTSDWTRTAKTEMHDAKEHGAASARSASPAGDETLVYKICRPDACSRCIEAYQEDDGTPRIFTLGELRRNGTNVGRKANEWLPVVGCMHPHCKCTLQRVE